MDTRVLVAYASKHGATEEIAVRIGQVLSQQGLPADIAQAAEAGDLTSYEAVVLGSAVYVGKWRKEAVKFLEANEEILADRKVWLFSSGPTGEGDPVELLQGWQLPDAQQAVADRINVRDIALFHGDLDKGKLNPIEKFMINAVKAPVGDFRDWDAITAWAMSIAAELKERVPAPEAQADA